MTDDVGKLVERLRKAANDADNFGDSYAGTRNEKFFREWSSFMREAADMLERLSERCEAYKGQVEAGGKATEHLRKENSRLFGALNDYEASTVNSRKMPSEEEIRTASKAFIAAIEADDYVYLDADNPRDCVIDGRIDVDKVMRAVLSALGASHDT